LVIEFGSDLRAAEDGIRDSLKSGYRRLYIILGSLRIGGIRGSPGLNSVLDFAPIYTTTSLDSCGFQTSRSLKARCVSIDPNHMIFCRSNDSVLFAI
jgi:hypothetical protein